MGEFDHSVTSELTSKLTCLNTNLDRQAICRTAFNALASGVFSRGGTCSSGRRETYAAIIRVKADVCQ